MAPIRQEGERNVGSPDRSLEIHLNCHLISGFARHIVAVAVVYLGSEALCRGKKQGKKRFVSRLVRTAYCPRAWSTLKSTKSPMEKTSKEPWQWRSALFARVRALDAVSAVRIVFTLPTRTWVPLRDVVAYTRAVHPLDATYNGSPALQLYSVDACRSRESSRVSLRQSINGDQGRVHTENDFTEILKNVAIQSGNWILVRYWSNINFYLILSINVILGSILEYYWNDNNGLEIY